MKTEASVMTIGEVARSVGIGVETIRFYERKGLIHEPPRRASGYRQYETGAVKRLKFIRRAKDLGFTLAEIKGLLDLRSGPDTQCEDIRLELEAKLEDIEQRIADLRHMKRAIKDFWQTCESSDPRGECPILMALERTGCEPL